MPIPASQPGSVGRRRAERQRPRECGVPLPGHSGKGREKFHGLPSTNREGVPARVSGSSARESRAGHPGEFPPEEPAAETGAA